MDGRLLTVQSLNKISMHIASGALCLAVCFCGVAFASGDKIDGLRKTADIKQIHNDWDTDGYWYFFSKSNVITYATIDVATSELCVNYFNRYDGDVKSFTVNKLAVPSRKELADYEFQVSNEYTAKNENKCAVHIVTEQDIDGSEFSWFVSGPPNSSFHGNIITIRDHGVTRDEFLLIRKLETPYQWYDLVCSVDPYLSPVSSRVEVYGPMADCSHFIVVDGGVIRYGPGGTTKKGIPYPKGYRIVSTKEYLAMERTFIDRYGINQQGCEVPLKFIQFVNEELFGKASDRP